MATLDGRALNAVLWRYPERIRQIDAMCDEAQLRGAADDPYDPWALGWILGLLDRARLAEEQDLRPPGLGPAVIFEYGALIGPLDRWLRERRYAA